MGEGQYPNSASCGACWDYGGCDVIRNTEPWRGLGEKARGIAPNIFVGLVRGKLRDLRITVTLQPIANLGNYRAAGRFRADPFDRASNMGKELILSMSVSVDGFVAGPNGETDWIFRNSSEASSQWLADQLGQVSLHAMGSRSYQGMADYWPTASGPFARPMNEIPKAVFSRSGAVSPPNLEKSLAALENATIDQAVLDGWRNPIVAGTDLVADVRRLKAVDGTPINALGGASFASSLIAARLVDVFRLVVHPEVLGRGLPIFAGLESPIHLKLEDLKTFDTGVVVKTYRPLYA